MMAVGKRLPHLFLRPSLPCTSNRKMSTTPQYSSSSIAPVAHAIGGSLGGALALLLLYPLERARIEMQSSAVLPSPTRSEQLELVKAEPELEVVQQVPKSSSLSKIFFKPKKTKKHRKTKSEDSWASVSALLEDNQKDASAMQASSSSTTTARLSLRQCLRRLWQRHELYRGVGPVVFTLSTSNFVFFYVNALMKRLILPENKQLRSHTSWILFASCLAGILNVLLTNPLWVANLRIVTGEATSSSIFGELKNMAREEGLPHLWTGTGTSILLVSNPVIQFFTYEQFKSTRKKVTLPPLEAFVAGALAKMIATIVTYPLQLAQAVLRLQRGGAKPNTDQDDTGLLYRGTFDCLSKLYRRGGVGGLFTGMRAKLLQTVLTAAFTFLTYEQILQAVHQAHMQLLAGKQKL